MIRAFNGKMRNCSRFRRKVHQ